MKSVKKKILLILSLLPLPLAFTFAAEYSANIDPSCFSEEDYYQEFIRRFQQNSLPKNFSDFLAKHDILSLEDLFHPDNKQLKELILKRFQDYKTDSDLKSNSVISLR